MSNLNCIQTMVLDPSETTPLGRAFLSSHAPVQASRAVLKTKWQQPQTLHQTAKNPPAPPNRVQLPPLPSLQALRSPPPGKPPLHSSPICLPRPFFLVLVLFFFLVGGGYQKALKCLYESHPQILLPSTGAVGGAGERPAGSAQVSWARPRPPEGHCYGRLQVSHTRGSCPVGCGSASPCAHFQQHPSHSITNPRTRLPNQLSHACRGDRPVSLALETGPQTQHHTPGTRSYGTAHLQAAHPRLHPLPTSWSPAPPQSSGPLPHRALCHRPDMARRWLSAQAPLPPSHLSQTLLVTGGQDQWPPSKMLVASTASRGISSSSSPSPRAALIKSVSLADFVSQIFIILVLIIRLTEQNTYSKEVISQVHSISG